MKIMFVDLASELSGKEEVEEMDTGGAAQVDT